MLHSMALGFCLIILAGCATGVIEGGVDPDPTSAVGQQQPYPGLAPNPSPKTGFQPSGGPMWNAEGFRMGSGDQVVCYDTYNWQSGRPGTNCSEVPR